MSREEAIKIIKECKEKGFKHTFYTLNQYHEAIDIAIKALEQKSCEDEYIKVPKKALKYRTAGMVAYNAEWLKNNFDIERAVICGEQEPKTDTWSIKEVTDALERHGLIVKQEPKTGEWQQDLDGTYLCSECGSGFKEQPTLMGKPMFLWCPNCGCRMVEPQESEDKG